MERIKELLRLVLDRLQCKSVSGIVLFGGGVNWAISPSRLPAGPRVLSGGVGNDISFEYELIDKLNARIVVFDPSPTGKKTIKNLSPLPATLNYIELGLAGKGGVVGFTKPQDSIEGSWRRLPGNSDFNFECVDYKTALKMAGWDGCDLIKIDIEGFEYDFLASILKDGPLPCQIAVEMHGFLPGHSIWDSLRLRRYLKHLGYRLVWKRRQDHLFILSEKLV